MNQNGCSDTSDCVLIQFNGLTEHQYTGLNVYPNPSTGMIYFNRHLKAAQLFDAQGRKLIDIEGREANISHLKPGVYWIKASAASVRIIKE